MKQFLILEKPVFSIKSKSEKERESKEKKQHWNTYTLLDEDDSMYNYILCESLANGSSFEFNYLYEEIPASEVYKKLATRKALNWSND